MSKRVSKRKSPPTVPPKYPKVVEHWGEPYLQLHWTGDMPTNAINGSIRIERYRVRYEDHGIDCPEKNR